MLFDLFGPLLGPLLIVIMVIVVFKSCWRKCPPDKLMIVSGFGQTRNVSGKGTFVIPGLQRVDTLALGAVQVQLSTENEIPTQDAILIHACAVANFQIGQTPELIEIASKNYLNMDKAEMTRQVTEVMLGKMREVIGQMDLKELMRDRESFNHKVFEGSRDDLANLGLELRTFNVQDFSDSQGIIRSMGADQAAEIKKEAELAQIRAEQEVAERQNQLDLKKAELKKTADKAAAEADMVKQTVTAEKQRELYVAQQEAQIAAETKKVELAERQVAVKERELDATVRKQAEADRYAAEQKADAELLLSKCRKEERFTVQKMERKEKSESPPPLYDLTALQRDANRLLGFTAQQTLDYAQSLYEKRLITYPRTDSRFLTEDMAASLPGLVTDTGRAFAVEESFPIHVQQVINGSKVTDHHALLPTKSMANADLAALPAGERNILRLIAARLLCAVGEPHRYAETTMTTICADEEFTAKGKVVLSDGWKGIERKMLGDLLGKKKEPAVLPDVQEQSECGIIGAELKEGQTSAPKHFTEDLLLHSMETASADSMPEDVERQGIGTPATRAATIEKLVQKGFLERKGDKKTKILLPTDKGKALIAVMPEEIQSPEMTADWETKLLRIERGQMEPEEFMVEIKDMISSLVNTTEAMKGANVLMKNKIVGVCPNCGANVVEREKGWFCENRECRFALWKDNAYFKRLGKHLDGRMVDKLLRDGRVRLKDCKSAKGKTYNATVLLGTEPDGRSKFSLEFENGGC